MTTQRQRYDAWFAGRKSRASEQAAIPVVLALADACDAAIATGRLADEHAALMLAALADKASMVWANAKEMVGWLQAAGVDTAPVLRTLFAHKRAKLRVLVLRCLTSGAAQNTLVDDLLLAALSDKDSAVRFEAASIATLSFRKKWLAAHMHAVAKESVGGARLLRLLMHGHIANRMPDGSHRLEVLNRGYGITYRDVSEEDIVGHGLAFLVEQTRDKGPFIESDRVALPVEDERVFDDTRPNPRHPWAPLYRSARTA